MTRPTSPRPTLTLPARDILPARERGWDEVVVGTDGSPSALSGARLGLPGGAAAGLFPSSGDRG
jgi:hypothetical protein